MAAATPGDAAGDPWLFVSGVEGGGASGDGASGGCASGGGASGGGASGGGASGEDGDVRPRSPEQAAAAALASAVLASPAKTSHQWASSYGGVYLDDDIWEIRFNFPGKDDLERTLCQSDITVKNSMALIEGHGYGYADTMYFVKQKGTGFEGMEVVANMAKVQEMIHIFGQEKVLNLTVIRQNGHVPPGLNLPVVEAQLRIEEPVVLSVDKDGVTYISDDEEAVYPVAVDYSDILFLGTQQSCNMEKGKAHVTGDSVLVEEIASDNEDDDVFYMGEYKHVEHDKAIVYELEYIGELKRKRAETVDPEELLMVERMQAEKRQRDDPEEHIEGETDVEELCSSDEESEEEEFVADDDVEKNWVKGKGPTTRCHHEEVLEELNYFVPTSDEDSSPDELGDSDDNGHVKKFALASGNKWKLKKMKKGVV